ncbi:MAG: putative transport system permease protein, partial [Actinomycetota bacterium]|nr:putative transport system permease protein [Actinomycetota bacterium]
MSAVAVLVRSLLRRRWRSYLAIALIVGIGGGVALTAGAAARRTLSAYPAYLRSAHVSDLSVITGALDTGSAADFARLDAVVPGGAATYGQINVGPLTPKGDFATDSLPVFEQVGSIDGRYLVQDRMAVIRGRLPRLDRTDEVAVNEAFADFYNIDVGHVFSFGVAPADQGDQPGQGFEAGPLSRFKARVVGVGLLPGEVVQDDVDRIPRIVFTPALTKPNVASINYGWEGLRLRDGPRAVHAVERTLTAKAKTAGTDGIAFQEQAATTDKVQRSVRPLATSLGVFAGIVALAVVVLAALTLSRQLTFERA